jgi:hypothetical protein
MDRALSLYRLYLPFCEMELFGLVLHSVHTSWSSEVIFLSETWIIFVAPWISSNPVAAGVRHGLIY